MKKTVMILVGAIAASCAFAGPVLEPGKIEVVVAANAPRPDAHRKKPPPSFADGGDCQMDRVIPAGWPRFPPGSPGGWRWDRRWGREWVPAWGPGWVPA